MNTFASLNLSDQFLQTLAAEGYEKPTPIQAQAIPPVLHGLDLLGCAQTGTGKTAAFSLPLIQRLLDGVEDGGRGNERRPRALVLAPTRELAVQIEDSLRTYGRGTGFRGVLIYGGVKQFKQVRQLQAGVDVIVATPGRLLDLMDQGHVDLGAIEMFVLDEADRMLDMGFVEPIRKIGRALPTERQTLLFSATMPPKIRQLADSMLRDPVSVSVTPAVATAPLIDQRLYHVPGEHKPTLLAHLLADATIDRTVVFTRTKHGADRLAKKLVRDGVSADAIHGNKSQNQRQRALDAFRSGRSRVLVATDVAARGLDVDGITHVFNYDLPNEPEAYVHRIGRTGRAGSTGLAISFCSRDERAYLRAIERLTGERIETTRVPSDIGVEEDAPSVDDRGFEPSGRGGRPPRRKPASGAPRSGGWPSGKGDAKAGGRQGSGARQNPKGKRPRGKPGAGVSGASGSRSGGQSGGQAGGQHGGRGSGRRKNAPNGRSSSSRPR
ncbi:MAG: DEAD/DEAH box helicase [Phycisphaerae bacterium]|nr:DEAD/DEAH box helicase [Phycisphaerae bacterium]